jgi:multiple sugar transport system ATP-binding protein
MARVALNHLTKSFTDKSGALVTAVQDVSLTVEEGEFMVLVGPSGCGKSTTLRMIAGLEEISSGTITIGDRVVNDVPPKDRDIAMVFQNYALYPHMTVSENMAFGLKLRGLPRAEIEQRVREAAVLLGLEDLLERKPKALSGGQRQRVAVGRAIVRQPKVFLFDEPLSNLDAKMRVAMRAEISRLHARLGATMVYVTHDQVEAMTMGSRICVMKDGAIMQVAAPLELYRQPANLFVASFIGSPPMNFFRGRVRPAGGKVEFVEESSLAAPVTLPLSEPLARRAAPALAAGSPVVFGARPEDFYEMKDGAAPALTATVEVAELMGAETLLHLNTGATSFIVRLPSSEHFDPGQRVSLGLNLDRAHLFDPPTGRVLFA